MSTATEQYPKHELFADLLAQGFKIEGLGQLLKTIRKHLGMDVAFYSRFRATDRVLEEVDAEPGSGIRSGLVIPLDQGYCFKVASGVLPELIRDTSQVPAAVAIPETHTIPIGSHLSVPIRMRSGTVYGTLCCFRHHADLSLGERDIQMMRAFAELLAAQIDKDSEAAKLRGERLEIVRRVMTATSPRIVFQPIYSLRTGVLTGVECLSRFDGAGSLSTSDVFSVAAQVGMRRQLELVSTRRALAATECFPTWVQFGINSSPEAILDGSLAQTLQAHDPARLTLEITEHDIIADYDKLSAALDPLRRRGMRIAIDDAGAGYASMRHIVSLSPDFIKLDMSLVRCIDRDPARRALARALISFAREIGSRITAEGIETEGELDSLREIGVDAGQGYFLKEPLPLNDACRPDLHKLQLHSRQIHLVLSD